MLSLFGWRLGRYLAMHMSTVVWNPEAVSNGFHARCSFASAETLLFFGIVVFARVPRLFAVGQHLAVAESAVVVKGAA